MLECNRINFSEGINVKKTNSPKKMRYLSLMVFIDEHFKYEPYLCNGCHDLMQKALNDLMQKAMNLNDVAIVSVKGSK